MAIKDHKNVQDWINELSIGHTTETHFYFITNVDGSIRWIWPASNKKPVFLSLYSATSFKTKLFATVIRILFALRLQRYFVKKDFACFDCFPTDLNTDNTREWALFTGTKGPNRKLIIAGRDFNNQSCFTKLAITQNAINLLQNEISSIAYLNTKKLKRVIIPVTRSKSNRHLQISDVSTGKRSLNLTPTHAKALLEIAISTHSRAALHSTRVYQESIQTLKALQHSENIKLPKAILRKLDTLATNMDGFETIQWSLAHCDFTPWNCYVATSYIALYDLEMAQKEMPLAYDAFHFIIQKGILVERKSWTKIYTELKQSTCNVFFGGKEDEMKKYLNLYLLINTTYYLDIYNRQADWHQQISWLINTWNDALSHALTGTVSDRKLVLMDIFDFMQNQEYVALKLKGLLPEQISELSDVDLCTSKKQALLLADYLRKHSLVSVARIKKLSFMCTTELVLNNSQLLSLDGIWNLKRKNLVISDINSLMQNATQNEFGIKQPTVLAQTNYVSKFYAINKAQVPEQYYNHSFDMEMKEKSKSDKPEDIQKALLAILHTKPENQGLTYIKNTVYYMLDTLINLKKQRGFIVTFSGVDGAGKSTLIEITKERINKQLRKPVVVLRHRPSILPIISAWTMGKDAAEQKAAKTLPRQGQNASLTSSLARFLYYYTDYVLGQFYVYAKYVLRGKVVLYDRYYFDFINDSKRSNINLPEWLTTLGYKLIMKPHVNFFLYADSEIILARKQELDASTIKELTEKYMLLFEKLDKKERVSRYHCVKNLNLTESVDTIMAHLKLLVA